MKLKDLPVCGKKVLVRVDFNVPLNGAGEITDDTRIRAALPTIEYLLDKGASVILMSHLGRPRGIATSKLSLRPCATWLETLLKRPVAFAKDCVGPSAKSQVASLKPGALLLLENLRFCRAEEEPSLDPKYAQTLASYADFYVNDAFGVAHRAHSSTSTITQYFPQKCASGLLLDKEIAFLGEHFRSPPHPFYAIIGGAKVSSKLGTLHTLLDKVDTLFLGGAMAYTFLKARSISIGDSPCEDPLLPSAKDFLCTAEAKGTRVFLPEDLVISDAFSPSAHTKVVKTHQGIEPGWQGMDIGPSTQNQWSCALQRAAMVFWNGPLGVFEMPPFAKGTCAIAKTLATLDALTIIGGGDSASAINRLGIADQFSHISTGGGASLEYIERGHLPCIDALTSPLRNGSPPTIK